jgi:hypothetical protein
MDPSIILAISELLKLTIAGYAAYARQNGATEEQIEAMFQDAKAGLLTRDPANIP